MLRIVIASAASHLGLVQVGVHAISVKKKFSNHRVVSPKLTVIIII